MYQRFETGDLVPEWVFRADKPEIVGAIRFGQPCYGVRDSDGAYLFAASGGKFVEFEERETPTAEKVAIIGSPTYFINVNG